MFKIHSHYLLLLTLVVSTAHAPTFMFWRNATHTEDQTAKILGTYRSLTGASQAALPREYAEDGEIKRFQLDEMYLPKLDVTLPELFNWGDLDREYVADTDASVDDVSFDPDTSRGASIRLASLAGGSVFANLGGPGGSSGNRSNNSAESSTPDNSSNDGDSSQEGKGDPISSSPADESTPGGDESNNGSEDTGNTGGDQITDPTPPGVLDPVDPSPDPVPVPAPGALGLVALGLAGLQLAGRKKKQKRLAAS